MHSVVQAAGMLPRTELFLWGGVGGLVAGLLASTAPWLAEMMKSGEGADRVRVWAGIGLLLIHGVVGAVAALVVGHSSSLSQAIAFGIAGPAILKGAGEAAKAFT
jgi:hypothetical protein